MWVVRGSAVSCSATLPSVSTAVPRGAVKACPPTPRMVTQPHRTTMVSQLGPRLDFLGHITTGGHGSFDAHNLHSTPTSRSWPEGRRDASHVSGSWRWTAAHTSAPSPRVKRSPSRMLRVTGPGRRTGLTSIPSRNPGPSPSRRTSGSTTASRAATVGIRPVLGFGLV